MKSSIDGDTTESPWTCISMGEVGMPSRHPPQLGGKARGCFEDRNPHSPMSDESQDDPHPSCDFSLSRKIRSVDLTKIGKKITGSSERLRWNIPICRIWAISVNGCATHLRDCD